MKRYREYKEIDERYVKGPGMDWKNKHIKHKVYKTIKKMERKGIKRSFKVIKIGDVYCVMGDKIRFIAAKILAFEKLPCLIIDANKRRFLLRKNYKRNEIKDEKSKQERIEKCLIIAREITV